MDRVLRLVEALEQIPPSARRWAYRVGAAAVPLLVGYGVIAESTASLWLGLAGALLATGELGMAAKNTKTPAGE